MLFCKLLLQGLLLPLKLRVQQAEALLPLCSSCLGSFCSQIGRCQACRDVCMLSLTFLKTPAPNRISCIHGFKAHCRTNSGMPCFLAHRYDLCKVLCCRCRTIESCSILPLELCDFSVGSMQCSGGLNAALQLQLKLMQAALHLLKHERSLLSLLLSNSICILPFCHGEMISS